MAADTAHMLLCLQPWYAQCGLLMHETAAADTQAEGPAVLSSSAAKAMAPAASGSSRKAKKDKHKHKHKHSKDKHKHAKDSDTAKLSGLQMMRQERQAREALERTRQVNMLRGSVAGGPRYVLQRAVLDGCTFAAGQACVAQSIPAAGVAICCA